MRVWFGRLTTLLRNNNDHRKAFILAKLGRISDYSTYLTTNLLIYIVGFSLLSMAFSLSPCVVIGFNFETNERKIVKICC